jgi:ABC-type lipoprotein release transport system permease subunit
MIASRLYGVDPQDSLNLMMAAVLLLFVAFMASYIPARRASRIEPMAALRRA